MTNTAQAIRIQNDLHPCVPLMLPDATGGLQCRVVASAKALVAARLLRRRWRQSVPYSLPSSSTSAAALL